MLSMRDLKEIFGVSHMTIYKWERIGLLTPTTHTDGGYRRYSIEDVEVARRKVAKVERYRKRFEGPGGGDAK